MVDDNSTPAARSAAPQPNQNKTLPFRIPIPVILAAHARRRGTAVQLYQTFSFAWLAVIPETISFLAAAAIAVQSTTAPLSGQVTPGSRRLSADLERLSDDFGHVQWE
jgi:hypothetical protein